MAKTKKSNDADETAEILADSDFANTLRASNRQADSGNTRSWEEIKAEMEDNDGD